jgi:hypothetical protein
MSCYSCIDVERNSPRILVNNRTNALDCRTVSRGLISLGPLIILVLVLLHMTIILKGSSVVLATGDLPAKLTSRFSFADFFPPN